ncbi:hypothetical protein [Burkholderia pseudomallei]|uniref:hypothetical protein n=1 Tax=Burkholderia pseudomallei TaxID=28450 RepID=UPI0012B9B864|nr:hypothetical protein [Burkholderia pseudomallei]
MDNTGVSAGRGGYLVNADWQNRGRMRMVGVPLDVGVGRGVGNLRNACIPQTRVIFSRAPDFHSAETSGNPARALCRWPVAELRVGGRIRARHGAAELDEIRAIHMPTVPYARP